MLMVISPAKTLDYETQPNETQRKRKRTTAVSEKIPARKDALEDQLFDQGEFPP